MSTDAPVEERSNRIQNWLIVGVVLAFSAGIVAYISGHRDIVEAYIKATGIFGPIVSVGLFGVLGVSPVPSEILAVIVGAVYGPLWGTLIAFAGNMIASGIEYYVGGHIARMTDFEERRQNMPFGIGKFPAHSPLFLILARIVPGYGPKMVGIVGGMYRVPLWRYTWTAAIPNFIGSALFAAGGYTLIAALWATH